MDLWKWITVAEFIITVAGFLFTIIQVWKIKKVSDATAEAIADTQNKMQKIFSIVDFAKCVEQTKAIKEDILNKKYPTAHIRMVDLQDILIEYKQISKINKEDEDSKKLSELIEILKGDIKTIQNSFAADNNFSSIKQPKLLSNLDTLHHYLQEQKSIIKHQPQ